jgi:thiosulfate reductase cytochrome b subunit
MTRHVMNALLAGALTAISGIGLFVGMSGSQGWLAAPAYVVVAPGLYLAFFLGLGSGGHGAVLHTDIAQYVLTFWLWWGFVSLVARRGRAGRTDENTPAPRSSLS